MKTIVAEAFIKTSNKDFFYPSDSYLIECCKCLYLHLSKKEVDFRQIKEFVIEIRKAQGDGKVIGSYRYPIVNKSQM